MGNFQDNPIFRLEAQGESKGAVRFKEEIVSEMRALAKQIAALNKEWSQATVAASRATVTEEKKAFAERAKFVSEELKLKRAAMTTLRAEAATAPAQAVPAADLARQKSDQLRAEAAVRDAADAAEKRSVASRLANEQKALADRRKLLAMEQGQRDDFRQKEDAQRLQDIAANRAAEERKAQDAIRAIREAFRERRRLAGLAVQRAQVGPGGTLPFFPGGGFFGGVGSGASEAGGALAFHPAAAFGGQIEAAKALSAQQAALSPLQRGVQNIRTAWGEVSKQVKAVVPAINQGAKSVLGMALQTGAVALGFFTIFGALRRIVSGIREFLSEGIRLNALFQVMEVGVAATLAQNAKIVDSQGQQLTGLQAILGAQAATLDTQKEIAKAAFESGSNLQNFLEAFRIALPLALQMGSSVAESIEVTKRLVLAATAIGVPFDLVRLQIDDILRGVITTRTTLARVLGITQDQLRVQRQQGTIVEFIRQKTQSFMEGQELLANTFQLTANRAKLLAQIVSKELTEGAFKVLAALLKEITSSIAKIDEKTGELKLNPEFMRNIRSARDDLRDFALAVVGVIPGLFRFGEVVKRIFNSLGGLFKAGVGLTELAILPSLVPIAVLTGDMELLTRTAKDGARLIKEGFSDIGDAVTSNQGKFLDAADAVEAWEKRTRAAIAGGERAPLGQNLALRFQKEAGRIEKALADIQRRHPRAGGEELAARRETLEAEAFFRITGVRGTAQDFRVAAGQATQEIGAIASEARAKLAKATDVERLLAGTVATDEEKLRKAEPFLRAMGIPTAQGIDAALKAVRAKIPELKKLAALSRVDVPPHAEEAADREKRLRRELEERVARFELAAADQLLENQRKQSAIRREIAELGLRQAGSTKSEVEQRRTELAVQLRQLDVERELTEASRDRSISEERGEETAKGLKARVRGIQQEQQALRAQDEANAELLRGRAAVESLTQEGRLARLKAAATLDSAQAARLELDTEQSIIELENALAQIRAVATDRDLVAVAQARARLELAQAELAVLQAQNRILEARARLQEALLQLQQAVTAEEVREATLSVSDATLDGQRAGLALQQATAAVERTRLENQRAILEAMREQATLSDSVLGVMKTLSGVVSRFSASLPKSIGQFFATFEATTELSKDFVKNMQNAVRAQHELSEDSPEFINMMASSVNSLSGGIREMFRSWKAFKASVREGGFGDLVGLIGTVAANFKAGAAQGIGAALQVAGAVDPEPISAAILQAAGALLQVFGGAFTKAARKISKSIGNAINVTLNALNAGDKKLRDAIKELERQRQNAITQLSGKKGGKKELEGLLPEIDKALSDLKKRQKDIFESFDRELDNIRLPEALRDIGKTIDTLNQKVKEFLDAGGSALKAQEFVARSLQDTYRDTQQELTDAEQETISLLQQEIELQKQREKVIQDAADRERDVRSRLGLTRTLTPAQQAALEIREIRKARDEQLARLDEEQKKLEAQLDGRQTLFNLQSDSNALLERELEIIRAGNAEWVERVRLLQDFVASNQASFDAALAAFAPSSGANLLDGLLGTAGLGARNTTTVQVGTIALQAPPGMTPQQAAQWAAQGIQYIQTHPYETGIQWQW